MKTTDDGYAQPGVGLIGVGWMGRSLWRPGRLAS
jgi:hypothetical protein